MTENESATKLYEDRTTGELKIFGKEEKVDTRKYKYVGTMKRIAPFQWVWCE